MDDLDFFGKDFRKTLEMFHSFFLHKADELFKEIEIKPNTRIDFMLAHINTTINVIEKLHTLAEAEDNRQFSDEVMADLNKRKNELKEKMKQYEK